MIRLLLSYLLEGQIREFGSLFADPSLYIMLPVLVINYFLSYIIFFGEEYGWRYFLQSVLQKRFEEHPDPDHCLYLPFLFAKEYKEGK